jgi:hypothetical protein
MEIQRLNLDNTWLIRMDNKTILLDPWLIGPEIDYARWFNIQWLKDNPVPPTELISIDILIISQIFPDHFHRETISKLNPKKIICAASLSKEMKKLCPNAEILGMTKDQNECAIEGLKLKYIFPTKFFLPHFNAIYIQDEKQNILFAPHSVEPNDIPSDIKSIKILFTTMQRYALPFFLGGVLAPGSDVVEKLNKRLHPSYIISSHDGLKEAKGLVSVLAKITSIQDQKWSDDIIQKIYSINDYTIHEL